MKSVYLVIVVSVLAVLVTGQPIGVVTIQDDAAKVVMGGALDVTLSRTGAASLTANANLALAGALVVNTTRASLLRAPVSAARVNTSSLTATGALSLTGDIIASAAVTAGDAVTVTNTISADALKHGVIWYGRATSAATQHVVAGQIVPVAYDVVIQSTPLITPSGAGNIQWTLQLAGLYMVSAGVQMVAQQSPSKFPVSDDNLLLSIYEPAPVSKWHYTTKIMGKFARTTGYIHVPVGGATTIAVVVYQQYTDGCLNPTHHPCVAYLYEEDINFNQQTGEVPLELTITLVTAY